MAVNGSPTNHMVGSRVGNRVSDPIRNPTRTRPEQGQVGSDRTFLEAGFFGSDIERAGRLRIFSGRRGFLSISICKLGWFSFDLGTFDLRTFDLGHLILDT